MSSSPAIKSSTRVEKRTRSSYAGGRGGGTGRLIRNRRPGKRTSAPKSLLLPRVGSVARGSIGGSLNRGSTMTNRRYICSRFSLSLSPPRKRRKDGGACETHSARKSKFALPPTFPPFFFSSYFMRGVFEESFPSLFVASKNLDRLLLLRFPSRRIRYENGKN